MMMNTSDKRKHFRFPAYDDEAGVKLNRHNTRNQFLHDIKDGYSHHQGNDGNHSIVLDRVDMVGAPDYFGQDGLPNMTTEKASPKNRQPVIPIKKAAYTKKEVTKKEDKPKTLQEEEEVLVRQLNNQQYVEPKHQEYKSPQSSFSNKLYETDHSGRAKYKKREHRSVKFESSYSLPGENKKTIFKPKHIPVSMIEEEVSQPLDSPEKDEVMSDILKLTRDNMMMMIDDAVMLDDDHTGDQSDKKTNNRLEKSLSTIMEDEANINKKNNYFDK